MGIKDRYRRLTVIWEGQLSVKKLPWESTRNKTAQHIGRLWLGKIGRMGEKSVRLLSLSFTVMLAFVLRLERMRNLFI